MVERIHGDGRIQGCEGFVRVRNKVVEIRSQVVLLYEFLERLEEGIGKISAEEFDVGSGCV